MVKPLTKDQLTAARARGTAARNKPWWPTAAFYDRAHDAIAITMRSGYIFVVPRVQLPELRDASPRHLSRVELRGDGLHWGDLDVDVSVPGLYAKAMGALLSSESGRLGGRVTSEAKAAAARANGSKGGRPRKKATWK